MAVFRAKETFFIAKEDGKRQVTQGDLASAKDIKGIEHLYEEVIDANPTRAAKKAAATSEKAGDD